jgi:hypothetical protein
MTLIIGFYIAPMGFVIKLIFFCPLFCLQKRGQGNVFRLNVV